MKVLIALLTVFIIGNASPEEWQNFMSNSYNWYNKKVASSESHGEYLKVTEAWLKIAKRKYDTKKKRIGENLKFVCVMSRVSKRLNCAK